MAVEPAVEAVEAVEAGAPSSRPPYSFTISQLLDALPISLALQVGGREEGREEGREGGGERIREGGEGGEGGTPIRHTSSGRHPEGP